MMSHTCRIGSIDFDPDRLAADVARSRQFGFANPYGEFHHGECTCCYLWNERGDVNDPFLSSHDSPAQQTSYGRSLAYLSKVISRSFDMERLRFVRLAKLQPHSLIIPHRDYLELGNELRRFHVPIKTDPAIFFGEEKTVFRLKTGEIWFLDAAHIHSVASFSDDERIHLILDFSPGSDEGLVRDHQPNPGGTIPEESVVHRPPPSEAEREALEALHKLIDRDNYKDVLAILVRKYFRRNISLSKVYELLLTAAMRSRDPLLADTVQEFIDYFLKQRDNRWSPEVASAAASSATATSPAAVPATPKASL